MKMSEKDLIQKLESFKEIKPNADWAVWLKAHILQTQPQSGWYQKPKVKLAVFSFVQKYQKVLAPSLLAVFLFSSLTLAQTALPGDALYPVKTLAQNAKIYLASEKSKPVVRLEVAKARLEDLSKVQDNQEEVSAIAKNVRKDLEALPQEIKKIEKKQVALDVSKDVREKSQDLQALADKISLNDVEKEELNKSVEDSQSQILALIIQTTDEINQCPTYLQENIADLQAYFTDVEAGLYVWSREDIMQALNLLVEANDAFQAGDCLTAMERIESINQLLLIYSLEVQVETEIPESQD